ncbi:MAG: elongation factor P [Actinobacteria bacterium]|nr:elongation factor P [Actinomycetota bacterium]
MQINATQIREGQVLVIEGELYRVLWKMHRTPGKGNACMQTKLKHVINGRNLEKRFLSSERVERASLDTRSAQYLYPDASSFVFMDQETFEQFNLEQDALGERGAFIKEGEIYSVLFHEQLPLDLELPTSMVFEVTSAPPEVRKATASASLRPVTISNGMVIQAPAFIKTGDNIKINTDDRTYVERVKE